MAGFGGASADRLVELARELVGCGEARAWVGAGIAEWAALSAQPGQQKPRLAGVGFDADSATVMVAERLLNQRAPRRSRGIDLEEHLDEVGVPSVIAGLQLQRQELGAVAGRRRAPGSLEVA